jgi:hypothetical protein
MWQPVGWYGAFTRTWVGAVCRVKKCLELLGCWTEPPLFGKQRSALCTQIKINWLCSLGSSEGFIRFPIPFSQHLINNGYAIDPINELMGIFYLTKKGRHMNTLEKFYICLKTTRNNQINDKVCLNEKSTLDTIIQKRPHAWSHQGLKIPPYAKQITSVQGHFVLWQHKIYRKQAFTPISKNAINWINWTAKNRNITFVFYLLHIHPILLISCSFYP